MNPSLKISLGLHIGFGLLFATLHFWKPLKKIQNIPLEVFEIETPTPPQLKINPTQPPEKKPPPEISQKRAVFGISKNTITDTNSSANVEVKAGNTLAKEIDNLKLTDKDDESLPIPADNYLVTAMPVVTSIVKIPYPEAAKRAEIQGAVVMEMLVDDQGQVRDVKVIRGPGHGLDEAALEAMKNAKFKPGRIGDKPVAVKFKYKYIFEIGSE